MRPIDADAYSSEMKDRQQAAWDWRNQAIADEDDIKLARAEGAFTAFTEAKLTMDAQPTLNTWHSAKEPPKEHCWCFVYTDEPDMIMPIRIAFYTASCTGNGSWYHYEEADDISDEVDYWTEMTLEGPSILERLGLPWGIKQPKGGD